MFLFMSASMPACAAMCTLCSTCLTSVREAGCDMRLAIMHLASCPLLPLLELLLVVFQAIETGQGERWGGASHPLPRVIAFDPFCPPTLTPSQLFDAPRASCTEIIRNKNVRSELQLTQEERRGPPHVPSLLHLVPP